MHVDTTPRREPWWTPFRRPSTWIAIVGFGILSAVVESLGIPDPWAAVVFGALLAATVAVVTRSRSPWLPIVIFVAAFAARTVVRVGGWPAFLAFEGALLLLVLIGIVLRRRKTA
jgi:hypothetical protein